ncbi:IQ calmodulin-binding motif protein (macronuclear) [Tetrahymena thermophila SB210]|uniref:IQ calmodulin-binding motif protein n=1 Tax=Tetrahymena thermophila (strain SB210) TaxID=312017 RepID=Q24HX7_TETTS|nr:IQ calmodulin-binding motif protein [Tetrahymena thermophila SB210]EAS07461.1 IQ calmodulin-binding motif protein [Tetrahymena thermophila SB210]|eukprot:XP_001027703.1 IQ calmodulin-binding motif protein [Tetrahymena thermophila SB210]
MSYNQRDDYDEERSLNDEELERKIMADIENLESDDENNSMLNIENGSILIDDLIKRQNERIKLDELEYEKENQKLKDFLKNNKAGQEIFDDIDRELANAKKLIKVKVKKDPKPKSKPMSKTGSRQNSRAVQKRKDIEQQNQIINDQDDYNINLREQDKEQTAKSLSNQNIQINYNDLKNSKIQNQSYQKDIEQQDAEILDGQPMEDDDATEFLDDSEDEDNVSFVEIVDMFGEVVKVKPDIITESQYIEMKKKALLEREQKAKEIVFAEEKIKREFMAQEGLLSDEDSIMSQEFIEELKDELRMTTHGYMLKNADEQIENMKKSNLIDSMVANKNNSIVGLNKNGSLPSLAKNGSVGGLMKNSRVDAKNNLQNIEMTPEVKKKQFSSKQNLLSSIEKSQTNLQKSGMRQYELIMSGQKALKSSVTESIIFKQELEKKLQDKQDKINQEREIYDMEHEDLLSLEYEEFLQKKSFYQKDYKLPPQFAAYQEQPTPSLNDIYYDENQLRLLNVNFGEPLSLNDEGNILTRDSHQVSLEEAVKVVNRRRLAPPSLSNNNKVNNQKSENIVLGDLSYQASYNLTVRSTNSNLVNKNQVNKNNQNQAKIQNQMKDEENSLCKITILSKDKLKQFTKVEGEEGKEIVNAQNKVIKISKLEEKQAQQAIGFESFIEICFNKMQFCHQQLLQKYDKNNIIKELTRIFSSYQPKLIRQFFDIEQENIFQDDEDMFQESFGQSISNNASKLDSGGEIKKSLKQFLQFDIFKNFEKKRRLELKLEKLGDIEGLERLPNIEILSLAVNRIDKLDKLNQLNSSKIVELNLAQNQITDYSAIKNLKELRYLNLELNRITQMADLSSCKHLEVLNLNNNQIKKLENLSGNKQLRKLYLFRNKIESIGDSLKQNLFLEELDIGRNQIVSIDGLQNNILLKKLVLYYNFIKEIPKEFSLIFLVELYLNGNKLENINGIQYLPCLEYLHLGHNTIQKVTSLPMLPNLTTLIISFNKIQNFESVLNLVRASPNIKYIGFNDNDFVKRNISEDLRDLYDYLFLRYLPRLQEVNHQGIDIGKKRYLEMRFNQILKHKKQINSNTIQAFLNEFAIITRQHTFIQQQKRNRQMNLFAQNITFYKLDSSFTFNQLIQMWSISNLQIANSNSSRPPSSYQSQSTYSQLRPSSSSSNTNQQSYKQSQMVSSQNIITLNNSIFFQKDFFENKHKRSIHKIKSLGFKSTYKIKKNQKFYLKNLKKIITIQKCYKGYLLRKVVNFRKIFDQRSKHKYAIIIQKTYRGYRLRKKMKQRLARAKYQDDEDLPEFDDAWLNQPMDDFDTGLKIPENFDVMSFLNPPSINNKQNINQTNTNNFVKHSASQSQPQKNTLLPPLQQKPQPLIQNNNFMSNGVPLPTLNQKPPSPLVKKKLPTKSAVDYGNLLNTQKAKLNNRTDANSDFDALSNKEDTFSQSGASMKSEHIRKNAHSMASPSNSGLISSKKQNSTGKQLQPLKSYKVTEEEKQKIVEAHGFTNPELVQTFAYRIERMRKNKIKQQPLTAEQRYEKFLKASKK